jgi:hypothetical protein
MNNTIDIHLYFVTSTMKANHTCSFFYYPHLDYFTNIFTHQISRSRFLLRVTTLNSLCSERQSVLYDNTLHPTVEIRIITPLYRIRIKNKKGRNKYTM